MKCFFHTTLSLLLFANLTYGQGNTISESDLYGCWTKEHVTRENGPKNRIYHSCENADGKETVQNSSIILLGFNKCKFRTTIQDVIDPVVYQTVEGTWKYDQESGIVEIFYPKDFNKQIWAQIKEEHPDLEIPNPMMKMRFKIVGLENGRLEIEIITPNKAFN